VIAITLQYVSGTAAKEGGCVFRIESDRHVEIGYGAVGVPVLCIGEAAIGVNKGVLRIEFDRLVTVGDGLIDTANVSIDLAAVDIGESVFRIDSDRLAVVGNGMIRITLRLIRIAAVARCRVPSGAAPLNARMAIARPRNFAGVLNEPLYRRLNWRSGKARSRRAPSPE
jgi:hypothetical protein